MNVLLTGASGFIGTATLAALARRGHAIVATCTRVRENLPRGEAVEWVEWDATLSPEPEVEWPRLEAVVHLAVPRAVSSFPEGAEASYRVTVEATFRMLERARTSRVRRFVLASTGSALEAADRPALEDDATYSASSFYAATKGCAELLARAYAGQLSTAIVRLFHPYGPGGERFLVNRLLERVANGEEITIEGPEGIALNPAWVDDVADGISRAVESAEGGVFHLAGPESLTLRQLLLMMGEALGQSPRIRSVEAVPRGSHCGDCRRARELLGYNPRVGIREGIARLVSLMRHQPSDRLRTGETHE